MSDRIILEPNLGRRSFLLGTCALTATGLLGSDPALAANLEQRIDSYIKGLRRRGIIERDERTAWSVYDFRLDRKLVSINENTPMQAASLIKPIIAQAWFYRHQENPRRFVWNSRTRNLMEAMIRRSSNSATNHFISAAGDGDPRGVERLLKRKAPGVFQQLRLVEHIPPGGRTYRNQASARDYSRFLYALWNDRMPHVGRVRQIMHLANRDRLYHGPNNSARIFDKTGSTAMLCGNMGIIEARGRNGQRYPFTFIAIIEKRRRASNYTTWIRSRGDVIRQVSRMTYEEMRRLHRLV